MSFIFIVILPLSFFSLKYAFLYFPEYTDCAPISKFQYIFLISFLKKGHLIQPLILGSCWIWINVGQNVFAGSECYCTMRKTCKLILDIKIDSTVVTISYREFMEEIEVLSTHRYCPFFFSYNICWCATHHPSGWGDWNLYSPMGETRQCHWATRL